MRTAALSVNEDASGPCAAALARCVSYNPAEFTSIADIGAAIAVLIRLI
jgi:hypothetical protein